MYTGSPVSENLIRRKPSCREYPFSEFSDPLMLQAHCLPLRLRNRLPSKEKEAATTQSFPRCRMAAAAARLVFHTS